jgi:hypothetical protein
MVWVTPHGRFVYRFPAPPPPPPPALPPLRMHSTTRAWRRGDGHARDDAASTITYEDGLSGACGGGGGGGGGASTPAQQLSTASGGRIGPRVATEGQQRSTAGASPDAARRRPHAPRAAAATAPLPGPPVVFWPPLPLTASSRGVRPSRPPSEGLSALTAPLASGLGTTTAARAGRGCDEDEGVDVDMLVKRSSTRTSIRTRSVATRTACAVGAVEVSGEDAERDGAWAPAHMHPAGPSSPAVMMRGNAASEVDSWLVAAGGALAACHPSPCAAAGVAERGAAQPAHVRTDDGPGCTRGDGAVASGMRADGDAGVELSWSGAAAAAAAARLW